MFNARYLEVKHYGKVWMRKGLLFEGRIKRVCCPSFPRHNGTKLLT